jgi:hypothetical protein
MGQHRKVEAAPSAETDRFALRRAACMEFADGEPLVCLEGHDDALLGVAEVDGEPRAVYDANAIVRRLMRRDGMDREGRGSSLNTTWQALALVRPFLFEGFPERLRAERWPAQPDEPGVRAWLFVFIRRGTLSMDAMPPQGIGGNKGVSSRQRSPRLLNNNAARWRRARLGTGWRFARGLYNPGLRARESPRFAASPHLNWMIDATTVDLSQGLAQANPPRLHRHSRTRRHSWRGAYGGACLPDRGVARHGKDHGRPALFA